ncbi:MAG TPA: type II toxin-antitoxin system VapC family toxin [Kiritimatiellia bacterium]|nr:type II toxin-antitoxin system VapC family toxin [Kiritimatiellia bacterium]
MILDSTFLVDFERELRRGDSGPATAFLEQHADAPLSITFTIAGELAAGTSLGSDRARWESFIRPFSLLGFTPDVAWQFGALYRHLRASGTLIGANDLWIAATALTYDQPLATRNANEFARVPGLAVLTY